MRFSWVIAAITLVFVSTAYANAPDQSIRPIVRQELNPNTLTNNRAESAATKAPSRSVRPDRRLKSSKSVVKQAATIAQASDQKVRKHKPLRRLLNPFAKRKVKGSVCGIPEIMGSRQKSIPGRLKGCGVSDPVRVTSVSGVTLSQASLMDCETAKALNTWVKNSVQPAIGRKGGGLVGIKIAAHYSCRTRNNRKGAKISEHGKGRAVDVSGFRMRDGTTLTVLRDWNSRNRKIMRKVHNQACGPFGTVLGPNADRYHQDHFHFDTARYRSGSYCR